MRNSSIYRKILSGSVDSDQVPVRVTPSKTRYKCVLALGDACFECLEANGVQPCRLDTFFRRCALLQEPFLTERFPLLIPELYDQNDR